MRPELFCSPIPLASLATAGEGERKESLTLFKAGDITRCVERNCTEGVKKGARETCSHMMNQPRKREILVQFFSETRSPGKGSSGL